MEESARPELAARSNAGREFGHGAGFRLTLRL